MARAFVSASSQSGSAAINLSSFNQLSLSVWLNWTTFADVDHLAFELTANANTSSGGFFIDPDSSTPTGKFSLFWVQNGGTFATRALFTRPSAGALHHYVFQIDGTLTGSSAIPAIYVDGVSQTLTFQEITAGTSSFANASLFFMGRNNASLFADGQMSEVAIWAATSGNRGGALLTALEAQALFRGVRPTQIRQQSLAHYWPMFGLASPEPNLIGGVNMTLTNSPALAFGPPVRLLTRQPPPRLIPSPSGPPPGGGKGSGGGGGGKHGGGGGPGPGKAKWQQAQNDHRFATTRLAKYARWHPSIIALITTATKKVVGAPSPTRGIGKRRRIPLKLLREILEEQGSPWANELTALYKDAQEKEPENKQQAKALKRVIRKLPEHVLEPIDWGPIVLSLRAALSTNRTALVARHADEALESLKRQHREIEREEEEAIYALLLRD